MHVDLESALAEWWAGLRALAVKTTVDAAEQVTGHVSVAQHVWHLTDPLRLSLELQTYVASYATSHLGCSLYMLFWFPLAAQVLHSALAGSSSLQQELIKCVVHHETAQQHTCILLFVDTLA